MIKDNNKDISSISYNFLNLPEIINYSDGSTMTYYYTATGSKLKEVYVNGGNTTTREYVAGMLYINNVRQYLQTETGRVLSDFTYIHSISDHQGNIRVNFKNNNGTAQLIQEDHYYPFGLTTRSIISGPANKDLYSGKEWKDQNGEHWYDFGWRNYDATLGRWFNFDPLNEDYKFISPYTYTFSDPVNYIDPNGLRPRKVTKEDKEYKPNHDQDGDGSYWVDENGNPLSQAQISYYLTHGKYSEEDEVDPEWFDFVSSLGLRSVDVSNGEINWEKTQDWAAEFLISLDIANFSAELINKFYPFSQVCKSTNTFAIVE